MLTAADALRRNAHLRIDIVTSMFSQKTRDLIDLVCHITLMMPFCILMGIAKLLFWAFTVPMIGRLRRHVGGVIGSEAESIGPGVAV